MRWEVWGLRFLLASRKLPRYSLQRTDLIPPSLTGVQVGEQDSISPQASMYIKPLMS